MSFKGKDHMVFKAPRTDNDIKRGMYNDHAFLDPTPPSQIEHKAWNMRPRTKEREIGPQFRYNHRN